MTMVFDWDVKHQTKQTNKLPSCLFKRFLVRNLFIEPSKFLKTLQMSQCMKFPTMLYVRLAKPRSCWTLEYSMSVKLLTEHHLEFLNLKGGCTGLSESTHVKMPHCWKSHAMAHFINYKTASIGSIGSVMRVYGRCNNYAPRGLYCLIRIYHELEGGIEKSIPRIAVWHHVVC